MNESGKHEEVEKVHSGATNPAAQKSAQGSMFKEDDYMPFMLGVFLIGGLFGMPFAYGTGIGLGYLESLPWALATCVVCLIAFRRDGAISWARAILAVAAIVIGGNIYSESTGNLAAAGRNSILGLPVVIVCGYIGLGIRRMFRKGSSF